MYQDMSVVHSCNTSIFPTVVVATTATENRWENRHGEKDAEI